MTIFNVDEKGVARDPFSGKIVDPLGMFPKVVRGIYSATPKQLHESTKIHAENAFQIARAAECGNFPMSPDNRKEGRWKKLFLG